MNNTQITAQSPGRINIIGEHTDYNDGFVLPAAIDKKSVFTLQKNGTDKVNLTANNVGETFTFDIADFKPMSGGWQNYVMGVVHELQKLGGKMEGFDGQFEGDVPIGSGMSSSAALECSLACGLNELFDLGFDHWQLIKACQMAEHNFVGIKCGIMDQFASMMGKKDQVMLLDCRSLAFEYIPCELGDYQLVLLNTNVTHALASSEYNTRRTECENGIAILQKQNAEIKSLRDVSMDLLQAHRTEMPELVYKRCHHVLTENNRVLEAVKALKENDIKSLGQFMYQSHLSLQIDYDVSCPELDYLVQLTIDKDYILGSRMMGGGFGGCTINLVAKDKVQSFVDWASQEYKNKFAIDLSHYLVHIGDGGGVVPKK